MDYDKLSLYTKYLVSSINYDFITERRERIKYNIRSKLIAATFILIYVFRYQTIYPIMRWVYSLFV